MENLKYYLDVKNDILLAYENSVEFFVAYNSQLGKWTSCEISFMQFKHDREFIEISHEDATLRANGNLPNKEYTKYLNMLKYNFGDR